VLWGISTEWWVLYFLVFVLALSICILLGIITTVVYSACRAAEECAIRSLDIPNIYKLILDNKSKIEGSKADRNCIPSLALDIRDYIDNKFLELEKLLSKVVSILEADQTNRDEISKAVSEINSEIGRGIQFKMFKKKP
jgi:hypothetical protein